MFDNDKPGYFQAAIGGVLGLLLVPAPALPTINTITDGNTSVESTANGEVWLLGAGTNRTATDDTFSEEGFSDVTLTVAGTLASDGDAVSDWFTTQG